MEESEFVRHIPCSTCGSSDANSEYDDGHTHCFNCGAHTGPTGAAVSSTVPAGFLSGDAVALPKRKLDAETCRKFGYTVGRDKHGQPVQVANYRDGDGKLTAQKIRGADKTFSVVGGGKNMPLFGRHLWSGKGRRIVVTEGEIDALSVAQACGLSWPVVSLPNGAQSARKALSNALEFLSGYETVVLCFDMDEPGRKAAAECADLFRPGQCTIAELSRKDANEMLVAGEVKELASAMWNARVYRPDGIVSLGDIRDRVLASPELGRAYCWDGPTQATFGRRPGEVIGLGAGSGVGKTDWFTQMIAHDALKLGVKVGVIYLEQAVGETGRRIAGKLAGKRFHVPDGSWTQAELEAAWDALEASGNVMLYDSWGALDWDTVKGKIRYLITGCGCQHIYLDHLTALAAAEDDEKKALEKIMAELAAVAQSTGAIIHFVSHLATPEGKAHEEGGRVMGRHFKGSRAIMFWSHFLFGLERDTQDPGTPTIMRCLKDRFTGQATGQTWSLDYDVDTGTLVENGSFKDETHNDF